MAEARHTRIDGEIGRWTSVKLSDTEDQPGLAVAALDTGRVKTGPGHLRLLKQPGRVEGEAVARFCLAAANAPRPEVQR